MAASADIGAFVDACPFYDSHSHLAGMDEGGPVDDRRDWSLAMILAHDYLAYLASSCSEVAIPLLALDTWLEGRHDRQFQAIQPLLEACRNLGTYAALREGIRALHGFAEDDITESNWEELDGRIREVYRAKGERAWQREVVQRFGVRRQAHICQFSYVAEHWPALPPSERAAQQAFLRPSLVLDGYAFTGLSQSHKARQRTMALLNVFPKNLEEYLALCETALDRFAAGGGRSVKLLAAYVRPLRFEEVPESAAKPLFDRALGGGAPAAAIRPLQDFLVWRLLEMAQARSLPLIVHTGYSIPTDWGHPEHLLPLFQSRRLARLPVALAHAGWPNHESALILARTYRNAWLDLSWNPLLSPTAAHRILAEAVDILPRNKILIGTDTATAESFCGTVRQVRATLAGTLAEKTQAGQFSAAEACRYAERILWKNPNAFFGEASGTEAPCPPWSR